MESKTTQGIKVTVEAEYESKNSFPSQNHFAFRYYITIENLRKETIILKKRHWLIYDVGHGFTEVSGEGVIGMTPEIPPGEKFTYFSNVILVSGFGYMAGEYTVWDKISQQQIEITIPKFSLMAGVLSN